MSIKRTFAVVPFLIMSSVSGVNAEVKLDGTLVTGTQGSIAGPNYAIEAAMGKQQGASLFHSFEKFNVGTGESAVFRGPADVERIISRVTGGSASNIDGLIKSEIQGADFYFINPFGMIFGPNASLDITGSFYATSADYVKLGENGRFDARNPEQTVLTADAPEAFGFLGQKPGDITVQARRETGIDAATGTPEYSGLELNGDSRMMLAGGDIKIDNGIVQTQAGNLDVAAVSSAGELDIESPDVKNFESLGKIEAVNEGHIYSKGGGDIKCQAASVEIFSNSDIETSARSGISKAGDVTVNARASVTVSGAGGGFASGIGSIVNNIPDTESGNIFIDTGVFNLSDGALTYSMNIGSLESGDIDVRASVATIEKSSSLATFSINGGSAGNISLDINRLNLLDGATINASISGGIGNAGNIDILASESVSVSGFYKSGESINTSAIYSKALYSEDATGGRIFIKAPDVVICNRGTLSVVSRNAGNSGSILFDVARLNLTDGGVVDASISGGKGEAGEINIKASSAVLVSGYYYESEDSIYTSRILSEALNSNEAVSGCISVDSADVVVEKKGKLSTESRKSGNAGDIFFNVERLKIEDGALISATIADGNGKSGDITVIGSESLLISDNGSIMSGSGNSLTSFGGNININVPDFTIQKAGTLSTGSAYAGNAGDIFIDTERLSLIDDGTISSLIYGGTGRAGDININAGESIFLSGKYHDDGFSDIKSMAKDSDNAEGKNNAGNISISAPDLVIDWGGYISSTADSGNAGNISLDIGRLQLSGGGHITAAAGKFGSAGSIDITAYKSILISGVDADDNAPSQISAPAKYSCDAFGSDITIKSPEITIEKGGLLSTLSIEAGDAGDITIDTMNLNVTDGASISSGIFKGVGNGGNIQINASDFTIQRGGTVGSASAFSGNAGDIFIDTERLRLINDGTISSLINGGNGKAGDISINAGESIFVSGKYQDGLSDIRAGASYSDKAEGGNISISSPDIMINAGGCLSTTAKDAGNAGNISLDVGRLWLFGGGYITAVVDGGLGRSGSIDINASESVIISGVDADDNSPTQISSLAKYSLDAYGTGIAIKSPEITIEKGGLLTASSIEAGDAGSINIDTINLGVTEDAGIMASIINGIGDAGDIRIKASDATIQKKGKISTISGNSGNAGDIFIDVERLNLFENGIISSSIIGGSGKAGNMDISANESVMIAGESYISSNANDSYSAEGGNISVKVPDFTIKQEGWLSTNSDDAGRSGNINLDVGKLQLFEGGTIYATISGGHGTAGDITINSYESVRVSGSDSFIDSSALDSELSSGGNVSIDSPETEVSDDAHIECFSYNSGNAGNISIRGDRFYNFSGRIYASASSSGGGNISFNINDLFFMNNGFVATEVLGGEGSGGNISIEKPELAALRESEINASAKGGNGGDINISSDYFIKDIPSILDASSELGIAGDIEIDSPDIDLNTGLVRLKGEYNDLTRFLHNPCLDRMCGKISTLTVGPRIARRQNPFAYLESDLN